MDCVIVMSDDSERGALAVKKKRINWYKDPNLNARLNKAANTFSSQKRKRPKLSEKKFCEANCKGCAKGISASVLRRFLANRSKCRSGSGQGRPFKCDALLYTPRYEDEVEELEGKLEWIDHIGIAMESFQFQNMKDFRDDKRKKKEAFVTYSVKSDYWKGLREEGEMLRYSSIHIVILNVRHYVYVHVKRNGGVFYYDSSRYKQSRSNANANKVIDKIKSRLDIYLYKDRKNCKVIQDGKVIQDDRNDEVVMIQDLPMQSNDVDCGVFALFFVDCIRNGFAIKPHLSDGEIKNYRGVIKRYLREYEKIPRAHKRIMY